MTLQLTQVVRDVRGGDNDGVIWMIFWMWTLYFKQRSNQNDQM